MIALLLPMLAFAGEPESYPPIAFDPPPVAGQETVIVVRDAFGALRAGETVQVVHRPGLDGERQIAIGITDSLGRVRWEPESAGVARVRAGDAETPVRVAWTEIPAQTTTLIALLGLCTSGWTAFGLLPRRRKPAR